jgi:hypothetical protein
MNSVGAGSFIGGHWVFSWEELYQAYCSLSSPCGSWTFRCFK